MKKILALVILSMVFGKAFSQSTYRTGFLPSFNLNQSLSSGWRINYKVETRILASQGIFSDPNPFSLNYGLTDLSIIGSQKSGLNNSLAFGYLLRLRDAAPNHRFIQQFTFVKRFSSWRLAQRISSDQTFDPNSPITFRLRYRLSAELPLNGQAVDRKELYFKLNHEYLVESQGKEQDLEIRLIPYLGYLINEQNKFELGLDYRLNRLWLSRPNRHSFWLALNWFISI